MNTSWQQHVDRRIYLFKMSPATIPPFLQANYEIHQWRHALAILQSDFPNEWQDIVTVLSSFRLKKSYITTLGGRKSKVADYIDSELTRLGWKERGFDTKFVIDDVAVDSPTHKVDCFKNRIALEVEWNNKDPFYDRDLNNFRLLFELRAVSVGVIVTRTVGLQTIFGALGRGSSFGASTTHMGRLLPKIEGGGAGGCPILVFGIRDSLYEDDELGIPSKADTPSASSLTSNSAASSVEPMPAEEIEDIT